VKFNLFILPTIPATPEERARLRPIGRNNDRYQQMLKEVRDIAQMAEDMGFDAMSTTEHHFHSEGFEASVAPLMLYTDLAARTRALHRRVCARVSRSLDERAGPTLSRHWRANGWL